MTTRNERTEKPRLFPALLKYWRGRRGLSQLDLALTADVSSKHISFLETGRANPSDEMVLRLGSTLNLPMREQNNLLRAAGFEPIYEERPLSEVEGAGIQRAIRRMMKQQEPYPMVVMNRLYDVIDMNDGAKRMLGQIIADPTALATGDGTARQLNAMTGLFDPRLFRPFIVGWDKTARLLVSRLHREVLHAPEDERLGQLLDDVLSFPDVPADWRNPDFSSASEATLTIRIQRGELRLAFLTTITVFSAPQNVTLEELRIESYFPLDDGTERACAAGT